MNKTTENREVPATYEAPAIERHVSSEDLDRESLYAGNGGGGSQAPPLMVDPVPLG